MSTLKLRTKVNFPATVTATGGLQIVKANGIWTVSPNFGELVELTSISGSDTKSIWAWDSVTDTYYTITVEALVDALGTGDFSTGLATSVDGEMVLFSGTGGKTGKRSTLTGGLLKSTAGIPAVATAGADYDLPLNFGLALSVGSSALTIAFKQSDGATNASATATINIRMPSSTATSGATNSRQVTGALSVVVPSTATLGQVSAFQGPLYVYAIDNAGTIEAAVSAKYFGQLGIVTTTTIAAASNSASTMYSTTGRSNVPYRLLARMLNTQATAGTWATVPSQVDINPTCPFEFRFKADKNAVDQTGVVSTVATKITFTNEQWDIGGRYDATNSKWYAPAGLCEFAITAYVTGTLTDAGLCGVALYKNGSLLDFAYIPTSGTANTSLQGYFQDVSNGTDYYEAFVLATTSSGTATVNGVVANTRFMGRTVNFPV